eukprot:3122383-Pyramimonas_sp.AAC.1
MMQAGSLGLSGRAQPCVAGRCRFPHQRPCVFKPRVMTRPRCSSGAEEPTHGPELTVKMVRAPLHACNDHSVE